MEKSRAILLVIVSLALVSCVGAVVGVVVDTTIAVAKVPFKVAGAAIDFAIPADDDE